MPRRPEQTVPESRKARPAGGQRSVDQAEEARPSTLIDASALIALLGGEPAADDVREILRDGAAITAVNLTEAIDRLGRRYGLEMDRVRPIVDALVEDALEVLPVTAVETWRAAEIRIAHYHRTTCPLSLADVVLIASGGPDRRIATLDSYVLQVAKREGIDTVPLPDSQGRRPD